MSMRAPVVVSPLKTYDASPSFVCAHCQF